MGVVFGVILMLAGAIIYWALNLNLDFVNDQTLGIIFMVVGVLAVVLSLIINAQRNRTKHIDERRVD
jgi:hypothetical protein